ncbi:MAG: diacylglycerol kinase family protein [Candidatus Magasanikbacteria bacterium]|nr:diacylglycerol kinase family protein [Candidatus Magasanikbacteria bacterium]
MKALSSFTKSFVFAARGIKTVWKEERSFRVQVLGAIAVCFLMATFSLKPWEYIVLTLTIAGVLILEIVNTVVERFVDMVKPRLHSYVGSIKDMMAGAVLLMSFAATIIGAIIFIPHIIAFVIQYAHEI